MREFECGSGIPRTRKVRNQMSLKLIVSATILLALSGSFFVASANEEQFSGVFVISEITVTKDDAYQRYRKAVRPVIEACGGTYVVRAGAKFVTENPTSGFLDTAGGWNPDRMIVLHFDTIEKVRECLSSPEYEAAHALREDGASGRTLVVAAFRPDM